MVQLNGVSQLNSNNPASGPFAAAGNPAGSPDFQSQLSAALNSALQKFGIDPSKVTITIGPSAGGVAPSASPAASSLTASSISPFTAATSSATIPAPTTSTEARFLTQDEIQPFDDAYWAKQPAAVQTLRKIDDQDARAEEANKLIAAGYSIDVPIMIWGWDPAKVTNLRQSYGYTWVPSAMQLPIEEAPGLAPFGTLHQYDPNNPPAGSIRV